MSKVTVQHIDGPATYEQAPPDVEAALRRRFEIPDGIAAVHPDRAGWYLFDVRNWWDGASEVKDNGDGTYTYTNPWNGESDTFPRPGPTARRMIGGRMVDVPMGDWTH